MRDGDILIRIQKLCKSFYRGEIEIPVLRGLNLEIKSGDFVALMGPSGSGKTTLLNIMAGIDSSTAGEIFILGEDIAKFSESDLDYWRNNTIGYIFQQYNLIPVLTAFENVELPLLLSSLSPEERKEHVEYALELVGLSERIDHTPKALSGGQCQRVAIARALVADPYIVLADEPTGNLDAKSSDDVLGLLQRLNEQFKKTFIMVTHDPKAAQAAKTIIHLEKGQLLA